MQKNRESILTQSGCRFIAAFDSKQDFISKEPPPEAVALNPGL
jgi:hypothetical protein